MPAPHYQRVIRYNLLIIAALLLLVTPTSAFGAGYVARGSHLKSTRFRHGDIALAIPLLATANRRLVKQIYFGNWLRDFSQLFDRGSLALIPRPILRALVAVFTFVQFGYATREFEVTDGRLGVYRPEEHVDNPRGYDTGSEPAATTPQASNQVQQGLRPPVRPTELDIDPVMGMKNYIANAVEVGAINPTSTEYVETQLIAAIACGRQGDEEAYIHLGAALHTLEDFVAHSNYIELAMQMIGKGMEERANMTLELGNVFPHVGRKAKVKTARGEAPPIVTGTFGALDLLQTLLGEIDDKLSAMSLPGLEIRSTGDPGVLQKLVKTLVGVLGGLMPGFEKDILKIQKAASSPEPANWGALQAQPEKLWESIEPVFKLRDDVVKWVYDHLTVRVVQDALATISTAIDKLVYMVLGIFLGPLLAELSRELQEQEKDILAKDEAVRLARGEESIYSSESFATDPTHSQLAKDHYDHPLNEIAGRVAVRISGYTTTGVVQLWQPGNVEDPLPTIKRVLEVFHHPFNGKSEIQSIMLEEVSAYVKQSLASNAEAFEADLRSLSSQEREAHVHSHISERTKQMWIPEEQQHSDFVEKMSVNIERQLRAGAVKGVKIGDFPEIKKVFSADPSGDSPNPLDAGLAKLAGISFLETFEGIGLNELAAAEGMGETLKDAVITMILLDETRGVEEEDVAAARFGWGKSEREKNERARLKELRGLLEIRRLKTQQVEQQFDSDSKKSGVAEKLEDGLAKMKLKFK